MVNIHARDVVNDGKGKEWKAGTIFFKVNYSVMDMYREVRYRCFRCASLCTMRRTKVLSTDL